MSDTQKLLKNIGLSPRPQLFFFF